jgi:hypothetical protein
MDHGTVIGTVAIVLSVATTAFGIINRSHIKSKCCGKTFEASIEVDRNVDSPKPKPEVAPEEIAIPIVEAIVSPPSIAKLYKESMSRRASLVA